MTNRRLPAAESLRREKAEQRSKTAKGQLEKWREDSLPASEPYFAYIDGNSIGPYRCQRGRKGKE